VQVVVPAPAVEVLADADALDEVGNIGGYGGGW
jgi:hypothetical protein